MYLSEANNHFDRVTNELFSTKPYVLLMPVKARDALIRLMQAAQFVMANERFEVILAPDENGVLDVELIEVSQNDSSDTNNSPHFGMSSDGIGNKSGYQYTIS